MGVGGIVSYSSTLVGMLWWYVASLVMFVLLYNGGVLGDLRERMGREREGGRWIEWHKRGGGAVGLWGCWRCF